MTIEAFIETYGIQPAVARGRWKPWTKQRMMELSSLNSRTVFPKIWDEVSGTAFVLDLKGQLLHVRVENLKMCEKYRGRKVDDKKLLQPVVTKTQEEKDAALAYEILKKLGLEPAK